MLESPRLLSDSALSEALAREPHSNPVWGATPAKIFYFFFSFARLAFCQLKPQTSPQLGQRGASTQTGEEAVLPSTSGGRRTPSAVASLQKHKNYPAAHKSCPTLPMAMGSSHFR